MNLVRIHRGYFDDRGEVDLAKVHEVQEVVAAMKEQGIYSYFSIYFPLWLQPKPGTPWLAGYDGKHHPFAALFFNKDFQAQYRTLWKALLLTPDAKTGKRLADDPAVAGLEIINEDSYFFWTFSPENIPDCAAPHPGTAVRPMASRAVWLAGGRREGVEGSENAAR